MSDYPNVQESLFVLHIRDIRDHLQSEKLLTDNTEMTCEDVINKKNAVLTSETQKRNGVVAIRAKRLKSLVNRHS